VTLFVYPQGQYSGNKAYYYSRDHLGSIREMRNSSDKVVARYDYDPFGRSTTVIGSTPTDSNFTGLYRHSASNLDLATYRAYDPDLGRWLSRDPIAEHGGVNLYGYVENDSLNGLDPSGLVTFFVHGTNSSTAAFTSDFVHHVMASYQDPNARFFNWSEGSLNQDNRDLLRHQAARALAIQIRDYRRDHPCERIQVVAHSHGGNVALLASHFESASIDELVTLGTPILADYRPGWIGAWNNISSTDDWVQTNALPYVSAARDDPSATNIHLRGFPHSRLHTVQAWDAAFPVGP
jgi:RHS repeat-associated protein